MKKFAATITLALLIGVFAATTCSAAWISGTVSEIRKYSDSTVVGIKQTSGATAFASLPSSDENYFLAIVLSAHSSGSNVEGFYSSGVWTAFKVVE
jgi:hypothetical protein